MTTKDNDENEIVLHNKNGEIKLAQCIQVQKVEINNNIINCYKDIPIKFKNNNKTISAFLTNQGIIKRVSQIISCNRFRRVNLPNSELYVVMSGNRIMIKNRRTKIKTLDEYEFKINKLDYTHGKEFIEEFNLLSELNKLIELKEENEVYYAHYNKEQDENENNNTIIAEIKNNGEIILTKIKNKSKFITQEIKHYSNNNYFNINGSNKILPILQN